MQAGTIIWGTLRNSDLLIAFRDALSTILDDRGENNASYGFGATVAHATWLAGFTEADVNYGKYSEEASEMIHELMNALDHFAPDGHYFGCIEGDASDFGFWKYDDESDA